MFHKQPMGFRLEKQQKKAARTLARSCHHRHGPCQLVWQKNLKGRNSRARPCHHKHGPMPSSLALGSSLIFGGTVTPLLGTAVPDIFSQDLHIFLPQSAPNSISFAPRLNLSYIYS